MADNYTIQVFNKDGSTKTLPYKDEQEYKKALTWFCHNGFSFDSSSSSKGYAHAMIFEEADE